MKTYLEKDYLSLSALQHILFCKRQCALIHIEQMWVENRYTAEGRVMHERVDRGDQIDKGRVRIEYSLPPEIKTSWCFRKSRCGGISQAGFSERKMDAFSCGIQKRKTQEKSVGQGSALCPGPVP